ncbi:hypothetical protein T07_356 [Trichinella nelsoni]|uniref:Uncharacterized protein n=1 Tax=Trichinella nelsoni TaxID=6336 RepID=A0A0V0SGZ4_9BILA|nr:hypothetical protein T07_356 [Trichinella nelsoni]
MHRSMFRTAFIIFIVCFSVFISDGDALQSADSQEGQSEVEVKGDQSSVTVEDRRDEDFTMMD